MSGTITILHIMSAATLAAGVSQPPSSSASSPAAAAQRADTANTCYRFTFGAWAPALDLRRAGHDPSANPLAGAAPGRDWAATDAKDDGVSLMLYPAWWPAGVRVQLPGGRPALGDTARGSAVALVADARVAPPRATTKAWGVQCGR
ncbi:MAG: hypothetical protein V4617_10315 [Gemmatimonadota bacterium]